MPRARSHERNSRHGADQTTLGVVPLDAGIAQQLVRADSSGNLDLFEVQVKVSATRRKAVHPKLLQARSPFAAPHLIEAFALPARLLKKPMNAETNIPPDKGRHRFSSDYKNLRLSVELLPCGGWFAGVYDMEAEGWLWT